MLARYLELGTLAPDISTLDLGARFLSPPPLTFYADYRLCTTWLYTINVWDTKLKRNSSGDTRTELTECRCWRRCARRGWRGCEAYASAAVRPPRIFPVIISVRGWVHLRTIVQLERVGQLKNSMMVGIEPGTFPLVAQSLSSMLPHALWMIKC